MLTDHQGNVRVSFEESGGVAVVRQENSYYPYGLTMPGSVRPSAANRNLYNGGSEWQDDFSDLPDLQHTFYRMYDAALGRFLGVDPEAEASDMMTTYHYALANPVMFNDPLGDRAAGGGYTMADMGWTSYRTGAGSGNNWSDGIQFSDWSPYGGSETYRMGLSIGFHDVGGVLSASDGNGGTFSIGYDNGAMAFYHSEPLPKKSTYITATIITEAEEDEKRGGKKKSANEKINDVEMAKYGPIISAYNVAFGGALGSLGGMVETGIVFTEKGWAQNYKTVYYSAGFASPSASLGSTTILPISTKRPPTFSDWQGAMVGFSASYGYLSGNVGFTSTYSAWGFGVSAAPASFSFPFMKDTKFSGSMNLGVTTLIGAPYKIGNFSSPGATERYIRTMNQGGQ